MKYNYLFLLLIITVNTYCLGQKYSSATIAEGFGSNKQKPPTVNNQNSGNKLVNKSEAGVIYNTTYSNNSSFKDAMEKVVTLMSTRYPDLENQIRISEANNENQKLSNLYNEEVDFLNNVLNLIPDERLSPFYTNSGDVSATDFSDFEKKINDKIQQRKKDILSLNNKITSTISNLTSSSKNNVGQSEKYANDLNNFLQSQGEDLKSKILNSTVEMNGKKISLSRSNPNNIDNPKSILDGIKIGKTDDFTQEDSINSKADIIYNVPNESIEVIPIVFFLDDAKKQNLYVSCSFIEIQRCSCASTFGLPDQKNYTPYNAYKYKSTYKVINNTPFSICIKEWIVDAGIPGNCIPSIKERECGDNCQINFFKLNTSHFFGNDYKGMFETIPYNLFLEPNSSATLAIDSFWSENRIREFTPSATMSWVKIDK